jgi:hypothetical protein
LRQNVEEFDLDHVAGLGGLDEDRSGQRMDATGIEMSEIRYGRLRADLAVDAVARFQDHFLALGNFEDRRDLGMITVVAALRFAGEGLCAIDTDGVHEAGSLKLKAGTRAYTGARSRFNGTPCGRVAARSLLQGTLASLEPSGDAKRIAALKDIIDLRTSIRALREALGMTSMTIY